MSDCRPSGPTALSLREDDFAVAPWTYPGTPLSASAVAAGGFLHPLRPAADPRNSLVTVGNGAQPLAEFLRAAGASDVGARTALVAVGSNASAVVMHRKLTEGRDGSVDTTVVYLTGAVHGLAVGHSAHIGRRGFLAAAPVVDRHATTPVVAALLDAHQLARIDETEPNYRRRRLTAPSFALRVDDDRAVDGFDVYVSKWDVLADPADGSRAMPFGTQERAFLAVTARSSALRTLLGDADHRTVITALAGDPGLRATATDLLGREGLAIRSGFDGPLIGA